MRWAIIGTFLLFLACGKDASQAPAPAQGATESLTYSVATTTDAAGVTALVDDLALVGQDGRDEFVGRLLPGGLRLGVTSEGEGAVRLQVDPATGRAGWPAEAAVAEVEVPRAVAARFAGLVREALERLQAHRTATGGVDDYVPFELALLAESEEGKVSVRIAERSGRFRVTHEATTPRRWIGGADHGQPLERSAPRARIACTVGFGIALDELNFFVDRAYGRLSFEQEGFDNFRLGAPHDWFTVTVEHWPDGRASTVMFRVALAEDSWVPLANAPASKEMGDLFINAFNSAMSDDAGAEDAAAAPSFTIPYYYDDAGGGVVQVRVTGEAGRFLVYYDLQTPWYGSTDALPDPLPIHVEPVEPEGGPGRLLVQFTPTDDVRASANLVEPLRGTIRGAIYRADDVEVFGPIEGAEPLESITMEDVDLTEVGSVAEYATGDLPAGDVKVLAFFDLDPDVSPAPDEPDEGDPVTVPLGSQRVVSGETSAVTVTFDLVL
jgi:hypothetical protein